MLLLSDTHFEWDKKANVNNIISQKTADDIVVLAGDITKGRKVIDFVKHITNLGYKVIYVAGNHEYYNYTIDEMNELLKKDFEKVENAYFLNNESVVIDGVRFIGSTLWAASDTIKYNPVMHSFKRDPEINYFVRNYVKKMADFQKIKDFNIEKMVDLFWDSFEYIQKETAIPFDGKTVVVSHYAPSEECISDNYKSQVYANHGMYSELTEFIQHAEIDFWLYGHLHNSKDFEINGTRLISNARGYHDLNSLNPEFTWFKSIKIT